MYFRLTMGIASFLIGLSGLALTATTLMAEAWEPSLGFFTIVGVCSLGGLVPLRLAWLHPLPVSLPLVAAVSMTAGAPAATSAGFLAGLLTVLRPDNDSEADWKQGFTTGGAMALCAGIIATGTGHFGLTTVRPGLYQFPGPAELILWTFVIGSAILMARVAAMSTGALGETAGWREFGLAMAGSVVCSMISLALAGAILVWGHGPVLASTAAAGIVALPLSWSIARQREALVTTARKACTGLAVVESIALAIEAKDRTSERHLRRMRVYSLAVGRRLGLSTDDLEALEYAALLHDIGKLVVPESILSKPAGLSSEEFQRVVAHPRVGAEILESTALPESVIEMVRYHHERYDGTGYPDGLMGMEIPIGARILTAADTFEALTSDRPYRRAMPVQEAIAHLQRNAGSLFDPRVVRILVEHHRDFEQEVIAEEDSNAPSLKAPLQRVLDRIASAHMEIYSLYEISQALGKTLDLEEMFRLVTGKISRLMHFSSCVVYIVDADEVTLRPRFSSGVGEAKLMENVIPLGQKMSGWAAAQRKTCCSSFGDSGSDLRAWNGNRSDLEVWANDPELGKLTSSLVAPMFVEDNLVGVVALYDVAEQEYSAQEEHLLALMTTQVAGAIRAGMLFEQTQQNALTDSLTGLPNSRYMFMAFDREATRAREENTPLTLMAMDIDNFQRINDDFGHHAGDRFLIGMAKAIRSKLQVRDTCVRYSGDEFIALLPGVMEEDAARIAEEVDRTAREHCLEAQPGRAVQLSLSIGWATLPHDGDDFESLMGTAVARMKQRKQERLEPAGAMEQTT